MSMSNQMNIEFPRDYTLRGVIHHKLGISSREEYTQKGQQKDDFFLHRQVEWRLHTPEAKNGSDGKREAKNRIF